ncbi:GntR family transcriptional regulator [Sediminispirochaeta smaragdinae]|uniref:GntR family transcriptional regulator n=1 Tax=Sediminispirochaeta smaragdinae TaxID=55206 RepID=UPI0009FD2EF6|nr:GntR family transcriptional regulator [Sediminispirochaeta smaragdinae]
MLAKRFEVSKNPIRKALIRLERENFVVIKPQYGTFVSEVSIEKGREICDVRSLLESYAARIAAEKITEKQIASLQKSFDHLDVLEKGSEEYSNCDNETSALSL